MNVREFNEALRDSNGKCEYIQSLSEESLAWLTLSAPEALSADLEEHTVNCEQCANTILNAQRRWIEQHPEQGPTQAETHQLLRVINPHVDSALPPRNI
jgi:hypothetical protein